MIMIYTSISESSTLVTELSNIYLFIRLCSIMPISHNLSLSHWFDYRYNQFVSYHFCYTTLDEILVYNTITQEMDFR